MLAAAADASNAVVDREGVNVAKLSAIKGEGGRVLDYPRRRKLERDALIDVECEIRISATRDVVARSIRRPVAGWFAQEPPVGVGVPGEGGDGSGRTVMKPNPQRPALPCG